MSVYVGQSKLRIQLTTGVDITGATTLLIKYIKPGGTAGQWTATSSDDSTGVIYYDIVDTELDTKGRWSLWAYVTFSDDRSARGETVKMAVCDANV